MGARVNRREISLAAHKANYLASYARQVGIPAPIVLFTFGKVGSTTVMQDLRATGSTVIHTHSITKRAVAAAIEPYKINPSAGFPLNAWRGDYVRWRWRVTRRIEDRHIVTIVRDPVARNVSAFFQVASAYGLLDLTRPSELDPDQVIEVFLRVFDEHWGPLEWYDLEFRSATGIDVYALPPPAGSASHHSLGRRHLTLLRAEDLRRSGAGALLKPVVGRRGDSPGYVKRGSDANRTQDKPIAGVYAQVLKRIRLPRTYLDSMYSSKYSMHFYTPTELEQFHERWSSGVEYK